MTSEPPYYFTNYRDDHPSFVSDVLSYRAKRETALAKVSRAANRDKRRLLIRQFLADRSMKLLYLFESIQAKGLLFQFLPEQMQHVAQRLSANHHYSELVVPKNLPAGHGGNRRTTYSFGPGKHALQRMVADLLKAMFPLPPDRHFTVQGGVQAALLAVEEHARQGFIHTTERDIAQFYPSVNLVELATLLRPLPFSVVMNVIAYAPGFVWSGSLTSPDAVHDTPLPLGGLLAQGSAASPIAAEVLMADLLRAMPDNVRVVSYADNVLILGETLDSVEAANAALEARVNGHTCGPLRLKPSAGFRNIQANGLTFLGNDGEWNGGGIDWTPKDATIEIVLRRIEETGNPDGVIKTIGWLRHWRRGYPLWKDGEVEVARYIAQLGARLAFSSPAKLSRPYSVGMQIVVEQCQRLCQLTGEYPIVSELLPDFQDDFERVGKRPQFIRAVELRLGIKTVSDQ